jgi:hypothetical protein
VAGHLLILFKPLPLLLGPRFYMNSHNPCHLRRNQLRLSHSIKDPSPRLQRSSFLFKSCSIHLTHIILPIEIKLRQQKILEPLGCQFRVCNASLQPILLLEFVPGCDVLLDVRANLRRLVWWRRRGANEPKVRAESGPFRFPCLWVLLIRYVVAFPARCGGEREREMERLTRNHVTRAIIRIRDPRFLRSWVRTDGSFAFNFCPEGEEDGNRGSERVEILVGHKTDDDVRARITPVPALVFRVGGYEIKLRVVEKRITVRGFETLLRFFVLRISKLVYYF